jgi:hypothetical protein
MASTARLTDDEEGKWRSPGVTLLRAFLGTLPDVLAEAIAEEMANEETTTIEMKVAAWRVNDILEGVWVQLASWFPPNHFGFSAQQFISRHIAARSGWHWALLDPTEDQLMNGTSTGLSVNGRVRAELVVMISETVEALTDWQRVEEPNFEFDFRDWLERWRRAAG